MARREEQMVDTGKGKHYEPVFVGRQPIFDREEQVWAYELLFRHSGEGPANIDDPDQATARVIADGFSLAMTGLAPDKRMLINFPTNLLVRDAAFSLPKDRCIIEILETVEPTPEILKALGRLKDAGYTLALDDFVGQPGFEPIIELADIIKVEIMGMDKGKLIKLSQQLKTTGCQLLAEKIEDKSEYNLVRSLGYSYFQGFYFAKPEIVPGRKISAGSVAKVQLIGELSKPDVEFRELEPIIMSDVSLSYRLLRFINSASFNLATKVESIGQAVKLLGLNQLRQWVMVVMIADMNPDPKAEEVAFSSLQRARFLERVHAHLEGPEMGRETMFLLGLLSMLDALLGQPMEEVVADMPLSDEIKAALCGEENESRIWIDLAMALEFGKWKEVKAILAKYGLNAANLAMDYARAAAWTRKVLGELKDTTKSSG